MATNEPQVPSEKLDIRIRATRETLMQLGRSADAAPSADLHTAVQELANTLEELEVTAEELRAFNDELQDQQLRLDAERRRFQSLFNAAPVAYLTTTPEGVVTAANAASLDLFGVSSRRLVGKPLALQVAEEDRRDFRTTVNRLSTGLPVVTLDCRFAVDGRDFTASMSGVVSTDDAGEPGELRWTLTDVTQARQAQAAMQLAFTSEREQVEHLTDLDRWKDAFLAAAAHDLRTPLTVISSIAEMLRGGEVEFSLAQRQDLLDTLHRQTVRMDRLLLDLLDLDRFSRGVATAHRVPTDVTELVRRVVSEQPAVTHEVAADVEDGLTGSFDDVRLGQIVANLLANALSHTPEGTSIRVAAHATDTGVRVVVEDTGPGVPQEVVDTLFSPFVTHPAYPGARGGTGLGLALVQLYAELHGGGAHLESPEDGGARFVVDLPAA